MYCSVFAAFTAELRHGLDPSMDWIAGLDWVGIFRELYGLNWIGAATVTPFLIL